MAGIEAKHVQMPAKRIWQNFANGSKQFCSIGWYRLPEREKLVNFSIPFHIDRPHTVVVAPKAWASVNAHTSLRGLLQDKTLKLGVVDGVSYGPELDVWISKSNNQIERRTVEPMLMMRMAGAERISFVMVDAEDWEYIRSREEDLNNLQNIDFADMPAGLTRYIVCSKDVSQDTLGKINHALAGLSEIQRK